jgi:hypothetical protein
MIEENQDASEGTGIFVKATRIASGCGREARHELIEWHRRHHIQLPLCQAFHLHLTPDFSRVKKGTEFAYFNKPFGVLHWMEHALGLPLAQQYGFQDAYLPIWIWFKWTKYLPLSSPLAPLAAKHRGQL